MAPWVFGSILLAMSLAKFPTFFLCYNLQHDRNPCNFGVETVK
jgi:hypothetical protein